VPGVYVQLARWPSEGHVQVPADTRT
jgi:hypothetical protein